MGLPLRMSNLHAPTVPSGPTTAPTTNGNATHLSFTELQRKKVDMEEELKALSGVLDSVWSSTFSFVLQMLISVQHGVDMNTSLLTPDGFPRADIDVAQSTNSLQLYVRKCPRFDSFSTDNTSSSYSFTERLQSPDGTRRETPPRTLCKPRRY